MTTRASLLAHILEHPDDDAARLVFADWLEDNGDRPRAEFIRFQIEWVRCAPDDPRKPVFERRARELLVQHGKKWAQEIPTWARRDAVLVRGFVMEIGATAREFFKGAPGLFRRAPVRSVTLRSASDAQILALASTGHLERLTGLNLSDNGLTDASLVPLFSASKLGALTTLDLRSNRFTNDTVRALAQSPRLHRLTALSLSNLARLTYFDPGLAIGDEGARALAESPFWRSLTVLNLNSCNLGPEGVRALAGSPVLASVERLILAGNHIGSEGARALAESPHLGRLTSLDVSWCGLDGQDFTRLRRRFGKGLIVR